jgi:hypothetical protein
MESATQRGVFTSEFYTMLLGNVVGALLASGKLTPSEAQSLSGALPTIGAIILMVVSTGGYILSRLLLKLKLGPVPNFLAPPDAPVSAPPPGVTNGPTSPTYAPPSTGSEPTPPPHDLPASAV